MKRTRTRYGIIMFAMIGLLVLGISVSCGTKKEDTTLTTTQAASSASAAKGAVALSDAVGLSTSLVTGAIPPNYASGRSAGGAPAGTGDISQLDPRMKDMVDQMSGILKKMGTQASSSRSAAMKAVRSAPSATVIINESPCPTTGTYDIQYSIDSSGTATTWRLSIAFNACRDDVNHTIVRGTFSALHTKDTASNDYEHARVVTGNLSITAMNELNTAITGTFEMNGTFDSVVENFDTQGMNTALGSLTWRKAGPLGTTVAIFTIGNSVPVTDAWTLSTGMTGTTVTHTGNGHYSLSISDPVTGSVSLGVTLTGLEHIVLKYANEDKDEWINGSVNLTWTPDLSQWGCLAGTYTFTTGQATPLHTHATEDCPRSGILQVNNAAIEYGKPVWPKVTVTVGTLTEVFTSCDKMGRGLCK